MNLIWIGFRWIGRLRLEFVDCVANAVVLMPVLAPAGEILSFASPKESIQRKGDPMPLASCALTVLSGVAGRDSCPSSKVRHPCRTPSGYSR